MLRFFLGVEVIERAMKLAETMCRGKMLVTVAEVVLAELSGHPPNGKRRTRFMIE